MKKRILVVALSLMATMVLATSSSAQSCSGFTGTNIQFIGGGSSAQFNTFAYAAEALLTAAGNGVNFWGGTGIKFQDLRFGSNPSDSATLWVAWDNAADCKVYAYASLDSTVGVKNFFAYRKVTAAGTSTTVNASAIDVTGSTVFGTCTVGTQAATGLPLCAGNGGVLPSGIVTFFQTSAETAGHQAVGGTPAHRPLPYCGQTGTTIAQDEYCFFNAGLTDIRPEDALYATTRALSAYSTTNGLVGLGYGQAACGAVGTTQGCAINDSFGQKKIFNPLSFKITGTDPVSSAALPAYTTLSTGIAPVIVIVSNSDTASLGLGSKVSGDYVFNNINRKVLANIYDGTLHCTGDILPVNSAGNIPGSGKPIQVVQREPLSGTYNTFEFGAVRTLTGSAATAVKESTKSSIQWLSDDQSGQELDINPATNFGTADCPFNTASAPSGATACGDPLYAPTGNPANTHGCGQGVRLRGVGGGNLVSAVIGSFNSVTSAGSPGWSVTDGIGYTFFSYGNVAALGSTCGTNSGTVSCASYLAHYLDVDGVDPLFITPGGQYDPTPNPNGAFNPPQCYLKGPAAISCFPIPFTHVKDGSYPIWSLLRVVTFQNNTAKHSTTPVGVIDIVANAQVAAGDGTKNLDDFVPLLQNITGSSGAWTGDLNVGVFRSHFKQTGGPTNPANGYVGCQTGGVFSFTGISILGGSSVSATCLVDAGSDEGGSVLTVQSDADFYNDIGSTGSPNPAEIYNLRQ